MERFTQPLRSAIVRFAQVKYDPQVEGRAAQWRVELRLLARTIQAWTRLSPKWTDRLMPAAVSVAAFVLEAVVVSGCVCPTKPYFYLRGPMGAYAEADQLADWLADWLRNEAK